MKALERRINESLQLGYSPKQAAATSSLSRRKIDYLIQEGKLKAKKIGRRVIIPGSELAKLLEV